MPSRSTTVVLLALAFVSGAAALAYEVIYFRSLGLVFGASSHAVAAVVGTFLLGLGAGAWLAGRLFDRCTPLRAYAWIELVIAAFAVAAMPLFRAARTMVEQQALALNSPLAVVAGALVLLAVPTLCMGATFPLLGRALASSSERASARIGWLYGINTLGGSAGALLAAFWMLPQLGLTGSARVAAAANVLVALVAWVLSSRLERGGQAADPRGSAPRPGAPPALLASVALVGGASIALQVIANRVLGSLLGGTVYVFAAILAVCLLGMALGAPIGGHLAQRSQAPARLLAVLGLLLAASIGLGMRALSVLTGGEDVLAGPDGMALIAPSERLLEFTPWRYLQRTCELAIVAIFGATLLSGAFFPAALRVAYGGTSLGPTLGRVYWWSTLGSIGGSLLASFALLPALGLRGAVATSMALAVLASTWSWSSSIARREPGSRVALVGATLALVFGCAALAPGDAPGARDGLSTVFVAESAASAAKVQEFSDAAEIEPIRNLRVNGKTVASSIFIDRRLQYLLGCVSVLAHDEPRSNLCIGLGTGMTSAAMAVAGGELTVVEISTAVVEAARRFERWNAKLHSRSDVRIVHDDGRAWLARTKQRFDVISADPIDPCVSGSAYLYTREYYELGRDRLATGGVMSQWIPLYDLAPVDVAGIVLTFRGVFPHATAWVTGYDMVLLGAVEPLTLDPARIEERLEDAQLRAMLADVGIDSADELIGCCFAAADTLASFAASADRPNTDEDPWIEFHAPLAAFGTYPLEVYRVLASSSDALPLAESVGNSARRSIAAHRRRLQQGALDFVASIEAGRGYGVARNHYIELLRNP